MQYPAVELQLGEGEGAGWKRLACACCVRVCCVWRGRDVDEERALFSFSRGSVNPAARRC